jgi:trehalose synthase
MGSPAPVQSYHSSLLARHQPLIGVRATERLLKKARRLFGLRVLHINSTRQGGGVAEILSSLTPLMNDVGVTAEFILEGAPQYFGFTKDIHNGLQGEPITPSRADMDLHREVALANAAAWRPLTSSSSTIHNRFRLSRLAGTRSGSGAVTSTSQRRFRTSGITLRPSSAVTTWRCCPFQNMGSRSPFRSASSCPRSTPFSLSNREMARVELFKHLDRYRIPKHLPLVVPAGRFDKWKDPQGVIDAFCIAAKELPATLVLAGNSAADDPEGLAMYESICACSNERIMVIAADDPLLVNALQRRASVVLQKSLREGFGLTVAEAMWKGRAVIGGEVGGIRHQIEHGRSGFLVKDVEAAASHIRVLLGDAKLRRNMGRRAHERVRRHFLMTRLLEDWLDAISSLERATAKPSWKQQLARIA